MAWIAINRSAQAQRFSIEKTAFGPGGALSLSR
jgi:hypothetical protein